MVVPKSLHKGEEDILICILYIPPSDSNWFKSGKSFNFEKLKQEIAFYELQASSIFIIGDYNARVGSENDYIVNDEIDEFLSLPNNYISDDAERLPRRVSRDQEFDERGHAHELISFCKSTGYRIANGRAGLDKEHGNFTCYKPNGNSTVDYLLAKEKDFDKISNLDTGELNEYSNHCFLSLKIKRNIPYAEENTNSSNKRSEETQNPRTDENLENLKTNYNKKFIYDNTCKDAIKETLHSTEIIDRLNELDKDFDKITVSVAYSRLRKILLKLAKDSMGKIDFNKSENPQKGKNHVPWRNDECKLLKRQLNISRKKYQEAIKSNANENIKTNMRDKYFEDRRNYHKLYRKQERAYWSKQKQNLNNLRSKEPKEFWNKLNMKPKGKSHNFSKIKLSSYFKNLASTNQSEHRNEPENAEPENIINLVKHIDSILNRNFNLLEVKAMIAKNSLQ